MENKYTSLVVYLNIEFRKDFAVLVNRMSIAINEGYSIYNATPDGTGGVYYVLRKKIR